MPEAMTPQKEMSMRIPTVAVLAVMAFGTTACSGMNNQQQRMLSGGAIGAAGGAVIGSLTGSWVAGALVGGAGGAAVGALMGGNR
jgi:osmotically inducible lipoprotein OsmB